MQVVSALKREFQPSKLLPGLTAGLIAAIVTISTEISLAALIWSGPLSLYLAGGIGLMLFGSFVVGVVVALASSIPGVVSIPQDTPAAIVALMAAGIAATMQAAGRSVYVTVVAAISISTLLMGLGFLLLGWFKASGFVRYIPYPVVGGFLAGTGFLLARGAFAVMVDMPMHLHDLPRMTSQDKLIEWVPGVVFAVVLLLLLRRSRHFLITPGALVLATALFYGYLLVSHTSVADASARGWLLGPFPGGGLYSPLGPADLAKIDWQAILLHVDKMATLLVLSVLALLLNASALEVTLGQDVDLDREIRAAGLANLAGGLGGASIGYQTLGMSTLAHRLGAKTRLVNLVSALICGAALFFGASLISYFPKVVLGGMLLYLGLSFLVEWLVDARRSLPLLDYLLVWLILGIIVVFGFLQGIVVGVFIAAILFVITYSRVNVIRNVLDGQVLHSNVDRPRLHRQLLAERGQEIFILRLQGFIFFGTVQAILERVRLRLRLGDPSRPRLSYLLLDFQRVTRLDSSAVFGITRLKQLALANDIWMVWTQLAPGLQAQLRRGGLLDESDASLIVLPTLDHGMEWCENKLLAGTGITDLTGFIERMESMLRKAFPGLQPVERIMKYLERRELLEGAYLMRQGDPGTEMYFIEAGMVNVQLEFADGQMLRLRSIRGGATVGEMGLYMGRERTASVVATRPSVVYRLSAEALQEMRRDDPEAAALLHEWIARVLAERLAQNNQTIEALMD